VKALLIPTDDNAPTTFVDMDTDWPDDAQRHVGGHVEPIRLPLGGLAFVDEDAKVKADQPPINRRATALMVDMNVPTGNIHGPMLILGQTGLRVREIPQMLQTRLRRVGVWPSTEDAPNIV
jgi:hypothetical protein